MIAKLIEMAKKFREERERSVALGLTDAEQSIYYALVDNPSAQELMKEDVLGTMPRELAEATRRATEPGAALTTTSDGFPTNHPKTSGGS